MHISFSLRSSRWRPPDGDNASRSHLIRYCQVCGNKLHLQASIMPIFLVTSFAITCTLGTRHDHQDGIAWDARNTMLAAHKARHPESTSRGGYQQGSYFITSSPCRGFQSASNGCQGLQEQPSSILSHSPSGLTITAPIVYPTIARTLSAN